MPRGTKGLNQKLERFVDAQVEQEVKQIKKKYIHWVSLMKYMLNPEFLALMTIQYFDFVVEVRKKHRTLKANHLFILLYLNKVDWASTAEIRFFMRKTLPELPKYTNTDGLVHGGLVERTSVDLGKRKTRVLVITRAGRELINKAGDSGALKRALVFHKATTRPNQKSTYTRRKNFSKRNPELNLIQK